MSSHPVTDINNIVTNDISEDSSRNYCYKGDTYYDRVCGVSFGKAVYTREVDELKRGYKLVNPAGKDTQLWIDCDKTPPGFKDQTDWCDWSFIQGSL